MTQEQFNKHWQRIVDKHPNHFKGDDHETREYADWLGMFGSYEDQIFKDGLDYYFKNLANAWFPQMTIINNCIKLQHTQSQPEQGNEKIERSSIKPLYAAIQTAKKRIAAGEVQVGFTDNHFEDKYVPAARGDTRPRKVYYTTVDSMAECFIGMFEDYWVKPALVEHRKNKLKEPKRNRSAKEMLDGIFVMGGGKRIPQKLCYYCEQRLTKNDDVFECPKCQVVYQ